MTAKWQMKFSVDEYKVKIQCQLHKVNKEHLSDSSPSKARFEDCYR